MERMAAQDLGSKKITGVGWCALLENEVVVAEVPLEWRHGVAHRSLRGWFVLSFHDNPAELRALLTRVCHRTWTGSRGMHEKREMLGSAGSRLALPRKAAFFAH